jgi:CubicO group peptidase (beta-lactamase class C family)
LLASFTAVVVYGQDVVYAQSFGCADIGTATPMTPETVVEAASISKMMTAVMLMQLRDGGKLSLQDTVNTYLPGAEYLSPSGETISPTFLELASHSSGLPRDMLPLPTSTEEMLQRLQTTTAVSEPGTEFLYSNLGFALLGQVLATVAGVSYEEYVTENILLPLGMTSSGFPRLLPAVPQAGYATPYVSLSVTTDGVQPQPSEWQDLRVYNPAAGLYTTAIDMVQVLKLVFSGGNVVLSASSLEEMQQQVISALPALEGIGIGWEIYVPGTDISFIGKDGVLSGFQEQLMFVPGSNVGVFVVANTADATDPNVPQIMFLAAEQMLASLVPVFQAAEK